MELQPGDEAMVPAVWDRNIPDEDFLAAEVRPEMRVHGLNCLPGVMPGGVTEGLVCVRNDSLEP